jgi:hypothetical protein
MLFRSVLLKSILLALNVLRNKAVDNGSATPKTSSWWRPETKGTGGNAVQIYFANAG